MTLACPLLIVKPLSCSSLHASKLMDTSRNEPPQSVVSVVCKEQASLLHRNADAHNSNASLNNKQKTNSLLARKIPSEAEGFHE